MSLGNATIVSDDEVLLLGSTILKIVLIHALGYFAASAGLLNKTALGGLGQFVRCFALPALLFQGIATLNMADLNAPLLCVVIIAKGCIFLATAGIGYLWQGNLRGSGIFALASTMSDDLGLGVPLLSPLFEEAHIKMLYILAAIQAIVFNPIAYVLLALGPEKPATIFISYRVASEKALALDLWKRLVARGLSVWLDQKDLEDGQPWEDGFADALLSSTIMVPLLSKAGLASFAGLRSDSSCDSLLLEQLLAVEQKKSGRLRAIYPLFVGSRDEATGEHANFFAEGGMPDLPDGSGSAVAAVDARALFHLRRWYGQATKLQSEDRSPRAILQAIVANQGGLMEGDYERSLEASVTRIEEMAHKLACGQQLEECEDGCSDKNATKAVQSRKQSMSANPAGEVQRGRRGGGSRGRRRRDGLSQGAVLRQVMVRVARETLANPLVVSCALGALYRGAFGTWLPESKAWVVFDTTKAVGLAFMPLVLFLAGASLVGSLGALNSVRALSLPLTLVACKSLLLPALGSLLAAALAPHASVFAFEYCALSTATSAYIIVKAGGSSDALLSSFSAALALGKAFCFLTVFLYAGLLRSESTDGLLYITAHFSIGCHMAGIVGTLWVLGGCVLEPATWRACPSLQSTAVLAMLQLAFSLSFASIGQGRILDISSRHTQCMLYTIVSLLRWTLNGWHLLSTAALVTADAAPPLTPPRGLLALPTRFAMSLLIGALATLPWVFASGFTFPVDPGLALWIPFGTTQELAYTAAYFLAALSIAGCVIAVTVRSRRRSGARGSAVGGADVELSAPPVGDRVTLRHAGGSGGWGEAPSAPAASAHASKDVEARELLKIEACITLVRCLGEAALCMGMRGSGLGLSTGSAQLILLVVALEDGQGVHTFFLFGLSPLVLRAYGRGLRRVQGCVQRAFRRLAPAESPSGADGADGTRLIHTQSHGFISAAAGTTSSPGW